MCGCVMRFIRGGQGKRKSRSSKASGSTMVDDTRLELAEACRFAPGIRRLFRLSKLKLEFGHKLRVLIPEEKRKPTAQISCRFLVDDTRLELAEACRFAPGIRRLFRLSKLKLEFGHKLRVLIPEEKRKPTAQISCRLLVDDTRLELVTSRTSSGCATSCANRPFSSATVILPDADRFVNTFFQFLT